MLLHAAFSARATINVISAAGAIAVTALAAAPLPFLLLSDALRALDPALSEAARVLRPGGRLLLIDMAPHDREDYRQRMGHVWLGFSDDHLRRLLTHAGFMDVRIQPLPLAPDAEGPALLAATARKRPLSSVAADRPGTVHSKAQTGVRS